MLQRGWVKCGLLDAWDIKYQRESVANHARLFEGDSSDYVPEGIEVQEMDVVDNSDDDDLTLVELCHKLLHDSQPDVIDPNASGAPSAKDGIHDDKDENENEDDIPLAKRFCGVGRRPVS